VVEGARLESEYTAKPYRGFESLPLRHLVFRIASNRQGQRQFGAVLRLFRQNPYRRERDERCYLRFCPPILRSPPRQYGMPVQPDIEISSGLMMPIRPERAGKLLELPRRPSCACSSPAPSSRRRAGPLQASCRPIAGTKQVASATSANRAAEGQAFPELRRWLLHHQYVHHEAWAHSNRLRAPRRGDRVRTFPSSADN
jgi:hypothetical protein